MFMCIYDVGVYIYVMCIYVIGEFSLHAIGVELLV